MLIGQGPWWPRFSSLTGCKGYWKFGFCSHPPPLGLSIIKSSPSPLTTVMTGGPRSQSVARDGAAAILLVALGAGSLPCPGGLPQYPKDCWLLLGSQHFLFYKFSFFFFLQILTAMLDFTKSEKIVISVGS